MYFENSACLSLFARIDLVCKIFLQFIYIEITILEYELRSLE